MRIELEFFGAQVSKKNRYRAVVNSKSGKAQLVKDRKLNAKLDYLVRQIPVEYFDLKLESPTITFQRYCPEVDLRQDRDNIFQSLLDLLVRVQTLRDDSDLYNNGAWHILPTQIADAQKVVLILETNE